MNEVDEHIESADPIETQLEAVGAGLEEGYEDGDSSDESRNVGEYSISTYGSDLEVELLVSRLNDGRYVIPDYQRGYVWTRKRASKLVESLLLGLPIPGIFLYKTASSFLVVDGHQRLKSLQYFLSGEFPGSEKKFRLTGVAKRYENRTFSELTPEDQLKLKASIIHASVIEQDKPDEGDGASSIYLIFERINSGSVPLTPHEIRYCANYGPFATAIKAWNDDPHWRALIGAKSPRMKDQELILRFLALSEAINSYSQPMQGFLDKFLSRNRSATDEQLSLWERMFRQTTKTVHETYGSNAFRRTSAVNMAVADAILVVVSEACQRGDLIRDAGALEHLKNDKAFIEAVTSSTSDQEKVLTRIERAREFLRSQ